jgi:hypothetical protein
MRVTGRNIYITKLKNVVAASGGPAAFATRAKESKFTAVWVRVGRGAALDSNFSWTGFSAVRAALDAAGIALWGWHVPFCVDRAAAADETAKVITWASEYNLAGVLLDAERTPEDPRFQGGDEEAQFYAGKVHAALTAAGRGVALSSHDQPAGHRDFPFAIFLERVEDNSPQVYYRSADVATRLNKSIRDYMPLEATRDFKDRYKPTGNITVAGDLPLPDVRTCLAATKNFIDLVHAKGYRGYSFWCWDTAPEEIWPLFKAAAV